jgi:streptogramin lyase
MRVVAAVLFSLALTGCSLGPAAAPTPEQGLSIRGNVHGGQQPIVGAHVYLFAANTTGYGQPSVSTLSPTAPNVATDSIGTYVTSDSNGAFSITGDYTCTTGTQVYLYALGGNPGAGSNSAAGLLAILGQCPVSGNFITATPFVIINEVTTVAAAYAFAGFATDATHVSSSGTPLAQTGIANAFANAANLANIAGGTALAVTSAGNGTVPQAEINTLANILAACINSTGPTAATCSTLFTSAKDGSTTPNDTATAAINIAHHPGSNLNVLYSLQTATAPFQPTLTFQPNDFTIALIFTGGGVLYPTDVAVDSDGDVWVADNGARVSKFNALGAALSGSGGYTGGGLADPDKIAIDLSGNAWFANAYGFGTSYSISELNSSGTAISGPNGYTGGGLDRPSGIGIDPSGNVWISNTYGNSISKFNSSGTPISNSLGYTGGGLSVPIGMAIDTSGYAWVANETNALSEFNPSGTPTSNFLGYTGGGLNTPFDGRSIAINAAGNIWVSNYNGNSLSQFNSSGTAISGASGYIGGGLNTPEAISIDGSGNVWAVNTNGVISEFNSSGTAISSASGYIGARQTMSYGIAVDGSGNVWTTNYTYSVSSSITEFIGAANPVVTPLAYAVKTNTLGTRP